MRYTIILTLLLVTACKTVKPVAAPVPSTIQSEQIKPANISLNGKIFSSLYQQRAAEYRALCYQSYNAARSAITSYTQVSTKPLAIVTDIDETLLDNSPYAIHQANSGKEYDLASWHEWTSKAAADTLPGAGSFLNFCMMRNVHVFYITNRDETERNATIRNMRAFMFPYADDLHLLLRQSTSSKETRRQDVLKNYEVILYMGDNLADHSALFDKKNEADRRTNTDALASDFGKKYIVFPNPNYGDWEGALYQYKYNLSQSQKDSIMQENLRKY